jgi:hypothetical protein
MATDAARRRAKQAATFRITFTIGDDHYAIAVLRPDPEVAAKAFRFRKLTGGLEVYDVSLTEHGPRCECLGFLRWQKPCKHIRTLIAAGMLP